MALTYFRFFWPKIVIVVQVLLFAFAGGSRTSREVTSQDRSAMEFSRYFVLSKLFIYFLQFYSVVCTILGRQNYLGWRSCSLHNKQFLGYCMLSDVTEYLVMSTMPSLLLGISCTEFYLCGRFCQMLTKNNYRLNNFLNLRFIN